MAPGVGSLWSFETRVREKGRRRTTQTPDGSHEYWLDRSNPLVNTILNVGRFVHAIGAGLPSTRAPIVFGVRASDLVDRIVLLRDLWPINEVERVSALSNLEIQRCMFLREARIWDARDPAQQTDSRGPSRHRTSE